MNTYFLHTSSSARKETIDTDFLVTSSNSDIKIMLPIRITSGPVVRMWK